MKINQIMLALVCAGTAFFGSARADQRQNENAFSPFVIKLGRSLSSSQEGLASWPYIGQNVRNSGVQKHETIINTSNVSTLTQAWAFTGLGTTAAVSSQPTVLDGIVYYADGGGTVYARDAVTGALIWQKTYNSGNSSPATGFSTSPTLTFDRIYLSTDTIYCLDRATGNLVWSQPLYKPGQYTYDYSGNCTIAENLVIVGVSSYEEDIPPPYVPKNQGRIMAFNKDTGELAWIVPLTSDQFKPHPKYAAGSGSYSSGAVDEKRKLFFIGNGNGYNYPPSPIGDSLICINYKRGKLEWYYSFSPGDVANFSITDSLVPYPPTTYDHDVGAHPNLFSVVKNGKKLDLVGVGCKNGHYAIFTRRQANPELVKPIVDIQLDEASYLGAIQSTAAINDGIMYIASNGYLLPPSGLRVSLDYAGGSAYEQTFVNVYLYGSIKTWAFDLEKLVAYGNTNGVIPQNAVLWSNEVSGVTYNGPLTYANGVLFETSALGRGFARALDASTGVELWRQTFTNSVGTGVTIVNGMIYIGVGFDISASPTSVGGVFAYKIP